MNECFLYIYFTFAETGSMDINETLLTSINLPLIAHIVVKPEAPHNKKPLFIFGVCVKLGDISNKTVTNT